MSQLHLTLKSKASAVFADPAGFNPGVRTDGFRAKPFYLSILTLAFALSGLSAFAKSVAMTAV